MNLQPLYELRERLESSMIAGVSLLSDDFRLARAVEQMAPLAGASPVFKRIYDTSQSALAPNCPDRCGAVLDAYSLADAVLCTQGIVETEGEISNLPLAEGKRVLSNAPYSALAPLLEALTTTGSGHYSTVVDMHKNQPELFQDYRLKDALIKGLGAGYSELADQVETWLCEEGEDIIPMLKRDLDPKGKKEMVRRIHIIESLRKEKDNDYYISLLDTAEKDVREAVILALRHDQGNVQKLLDLAKAEKGNCKKAAQAALTYMDAPEAIEYWEKSMKKKPGTAAPFLAFTKSDVMADMVAAALEEMTDRLLENVKEEKETSETDVNTFDTLMKSLSGKSSPAIIQWYRRVSQRALANSLDKLANSKKAQIKFSASSNSGFYSTYHYMSELPFTQVIPNVLTNAILSSPVQPLLGLAGELFASVGVEYFKPAIVAAFLSRPSSEVYEEFAPYIEDKKKIYYDSCLNTFYHGILGILSFDEISHRHEIGITVQDPLRYRERGVSFHQPLFEPLDVKWYQLFASGIFDRVKNWGPYNLTRTINPKDGRAREIMGEYFYRKALDPSTDPRSLFYCLKQCGWVGEKCSGVVVAAAKKNSNGTFWNFWNLVSNAPITDAQKAVELEQVAELVRKHKVNIKNWDEKRILDWCAELRAGK